MGTLLRAFCCGIATFIIKPEYAPVAEAQEDQERLQEQDIDLINIGPAWTRVAQRTHVMEGPASTNMRE